MFPLPGMAVPTHFSQQPMVVRLGLNACDRLDRRSLSPQLRAWTVALRCKASGMHVPDCVFREEGVVTFGQEDLQRVKAGWDHLRARDAQTS